MAEQREQKEKNIIIGKKDLSISIKGALLFTFYISLYGNLKHFIIFPIPYSKFHLAYPEIEDDNLKCAL